MIPTPTYMRSDIKHCPETWVITVYTDDYKAELSDKCKFEFVEEPPQDVKIVKNVISAGKKAKPFESKIRVTYKDEEKFINFSLK